MADPNFMAYMKKRQQGFNPYAAGNKQYPEGAPNVGPVSAEGQAGYDERDAKAKRMRNAMLRRMQASQSGRLMSADYLRGSQNGV